MMKNGLMELKMIDIYSFTDERINAVLSGCPLSIEERKFLIQDTPRFEECDIDAFHLAKMSDYELMEKSYSVWRDYCR